MANLYYSESVVTACSPEAAYDLVSDITRMGEWSPVCKACWWDEGDGPRVGAWFGDGAQAQIADRAENARTGIPATLAAIRKAAEAG